MSAPDSYDDLLVSLSPCGCVSCAWGTEVWCPACLEALSAELKVILQAAVQEAGVCLRCCREAPTVDQLFCQACYAELLVAEGHD